jgi:hypoxanthine phosphoribosyltransferase
MNKENARDDSAGRSWSVSPLLSAEQLAERVEELGKEISADYAGKDLLLVGVLKGAWVFLADLVRRLTIPACCDFVRLSSYGLEMATSGEPKLLLDMTERAEGRHVLVVDDIIDTGISISWLLRHIRRKNPASLRLCALLDKPARRRVEVKADYVGFEIPDQFVVGYGIDYAERCRELPYVGCVAVRDGQ